MTTARRLRNYAQVKPENRKVGSVFISLASISQNLIFFQVILFILMHPREISFLPPNTFRSIVGNRSGGRNKRLLWLVGSGNGAVTRRSILGCVEGFPYGQIIQPTCILG